jgi:hypothetical protein
VEIRRLSICRVWNLLKDDVVWLIELPAWFFTVSPLLERVNGSRQTRSEVLAERREQMLGTIFLLA